MTSSPRSFLIIQTAFTGDVILATSIAEKIHQFYPAANIDFLLRKGNESLLDGHPFIRNVLVWDKKKNKIRNLIRLIRRIRAERFSIVVNVHRFASSGFVTAFSRASLTIGFDKNPLSFLFGRKVKHEIGSGVHEINRNQQLIAPLTDDTPAMPKLYPGKKEFDAVSAFKNQDGQREYLCVAPTSVWFTKQFPVAKWIDFLNSPALAAMNVFLIGAPTDEQTVQEIVSSTSNKNVVNLAGKLSFLESAALMSAAKMNYVNDSAPMHLASALNAPVTAVYCSTVPAFGFGPLSERKLVVETREHLDCRPCGLHGYEQCPLGHFKCATTIGTDQLLQGLLV